jgi:hypothetical protein
MMNSEGNGNFRALVKAFICSSRDNNKSAK